MRTLLAVLLLTFPLMAVADRLEEGDCVVEVSHGEGHEARYRWHRYYSVSRCEDLKETGKVRIVYDDGTEKTPQFTGIVTQITHRMILK